MESAANTDISDETLFERLLLIRRVEEKTAELYPTDVIKSPIHLSIGQEAPSVVVCAALAAHDVVVGTYRGHALYLARGGDLDAMVAELFGKVEGCGRGKAGSMHLGDKSIGMPHASAIVATGVSNALGTAFAQKAMGRDGITACFIGDGAIDEGAVAESLNFAGLKRLPLLLVVENNGYAIHSSLSARMPRPNFVERAAVYDVAGTSTTDDDLAHMLKSAEAAVAAVRSGRGPFLLEIATYRWMEHVGPSEDWGLGYRDKDEALPWIENDPVKLLGERLPGMKRAAIEADVTARVERAFALAAQGAFPDAGETWEHVYA